MPKLATWSDRQGTCDWCLSCRETKFIFGAQKCAGEFTQSVDRRSFSRIQKNIMFREPSEIHNGPRYRSKFELMICFSELDKYHDRVTCLTCKNFAWNRAEFFSMKFYRLTVCERSVFRVELWWPLFVNIDNCVRNVWTVNLTIFSLFSYLFISFAWTTRAVYIIIIIILIFWPDNFN